MAGPPHPSQYGPPFFYDTRPAEYTTDTRSTLQNEHPLPPPAYGAYAQNMNALQQNAGLPPVNAPQLANAQNRDPALIAGLLQQLRDAGYPLTFPPELLGSTVPQQSQTQAPLPPQPTYHPPSSAALSQERVDDVVSSSREEGELSDAAMAVDTGVQGAGPKLAPAFGEIDTGDDSDFYRASPNRTSSDSSGRSKSVC